jgi:hypothetical protein
MKIDNCLPSPDALDESAYLVARGVRALALPGFPVRANEREAIRILTLLDSHALPGAIQFLIRRHDGPVEYGYAACQWVIDLLSWICSGNVPQAQVDRIFGLLLGYSAQAIRDHEELLTGRLKSEMNATTMEAILGR